MYYPLILAKTILLFPGVSPGQQAVIAQWMVDNITTLVDTIFFADERDQAILNKIATVGVPPDTSVPVYNGLSGAKLDLFRSLCEYSLDLAIEANTPGKSSPGGWPAGSKFFRAVVSQVGFRDPTLDYVIINDFGIFSFFTYLAGGTYLYSNFPAGVWPDPQKVFVIIDRLSPGGRWKTYTWSYADDQQLFIETFDSGSSSDDVLLSSLFTIVVIP